MNKHTDIKLDTTAAARLAQNEIANKAIALFGSEAVSTNCEITRKTSESNGIVYNADARLTVSVDLRKTDLAKRWIAAHAAGVAKGLKADDVRITGEGASQWDREAINLARLTGADTNYRPRDLWTINIAAETYPRRIRPVPYKNEWRQILSNGDWADISIAEVVAITVEATASIEAIKAYRIEGSLNGRRYDSNSRSFKIGTFIDSAAEKAQEQYDRFAAKVEYIERFVAEYDLAAEQALIAKAEAEFNARKARADFINGQIAEYSAEGFSAGRLDLRTAKLTVAEVDAILAILTGAAARIAAEQANQPARA